MVVSVIRMTVKLRLMQILQGIPKNCPQDCLNNISGCKNARWDLYTAVALSGVQNIFVQYQGDDILGNPNLIS